MAIRKRDPAESDLEQDECREECTASTGGQFNPDTANYQHTRIN